jgi:hypothetical protein
MESRWSMLRAEAGRKPRRSVVNHAIWNKKNKEVGRWRKSYWARKDAKMAEGLVRKKYRPSNLREEMLPTAAEEAIARDAVDVQSEDMLAEEAVDVPVVEN